MNKEDVQILFEITLSNLKSEGEVDEQDFLDRVDILCSLGYTVMISNFKKYYKVIEYLSQFSSKRMGLIIGANSLIEMFEERGLITKEGHKMTIPDYGFFKRIFG